MREASRDACLGARQDARPVGSRRALRAFAVMGAASLAGGVPSAQALPWSIDMVDAEMVKAYERPMAPLPEGVRSQPHLLTPIAWRRNWAFQGYTQAEPANPYAGATQDESLMALGERMYTVYCQPCHGNGPQLGPVGQPGKYPAVAILGGPDGRLQNLSDAWVYLTIRNGSMSKLMPAYGYAMTDDEMWALTTWMRQDEYFADGRGPAAPGDEETP